MSDDDVKTNLWEVGAGERCEWKYIADRSPSYKGYWAL
jgi:hypothetical protein